MKGGGGIAASSWDASSTAAPGLVGAGPIGGEVAVRARAFGMRVLAYDPYVSDARLRRSRSSVLPRWKRSSPPPTFSRSTLRSPTRRAASSGGPRGGLAPTAIVVNLARGGSSTRRRWSKHWTGPDRRRVLDVYEAEPLPADHPSAGADLILTASRASTVEAQRCRGGRLRGGA